MMKKFFDRQQAGIFLADELKDYANQPNTLVLGLPRGGVPVAGEVALALSLPLDVFIVRKLGLPGQEELAMGAIASGDMVIFDEALIKQLQVAPETRKKILNAEKKELKRREQLYRGDRPFPDLVGKTIILIDDGIATGFTMRVAVKALRKQKPVEIILATPVAAKATCAELAGLSDKIICPMQPKNFLAVSFWYTHFPQISDCEVMEWLQRN